MCRFRGLPDAQMQYIDDFVNSGRPIVGIRTSTHAFDLVDFLSLFSFVCVCVCVCVPVCTCTVEKNKKREVFFFFFYCLLKSFRS